MSRRVYLSKPVQQLVSALTVVSYSRDPKAAGPLLVSTRSWRNRSELRSAFEIGLIACPMARSTQVPAARPRHFGLESTRRESEPHNTPSTARTTTSSTMHDLLLPIANLPRPAVSSPPPGYAQIALQPATRQTIVTTTTTTTVHFAPILVPKPVKAAVLTDAEVAVMPPRPWHGRVPLRAGERLDPKLYPLANLLPPSTMSKFNLQLGDARARFVEADEVPFPKKDEDEETRGGASSDREVQRALLKAGPSSSSSSNLPTSNSPTKSSSALLNDHKGKGKARADDLSTKLSPRATRDRTASLRRRQEHTRRHLSGNTLDHASHSAGVSTSQGDGRSPGPPRKRVKADHHEVTSPVSLGTNVSTSSKHGVTRAAIAPSPSIATPLRPFSGPPPPLPSPQLSPSNPVHDLERGFVPASPPSSAAEGDLDGALTGDEGTAITATHPTTALNLGTGAELSALLSLPSLVDSFSQLDPNVQSYVLFQLLRRSSVPVLQTVNDIITPALKRDFVTDLPPELAVHLLGYLDGPSLCRACRVSRAWRRMIDSEWRVWKKRLMAEDLWVGHGSEQREIALIEGGPTHHRSAIFLRRWAEGLWDFEFDVNIAARPTTDKLQRARFEQRLTPVADDSFASDRVDGSMSPASDKMFASYSQRPPATNAQNATATNSDSSHHVHPLKLLYRRRFVTRRNWHQVEPRRITFPGQANNVVTCLQFDRERIVSASDDHTIHVFDTRNGRIKARLDGHEGGVWALQYIGNVLVSGSTDRTVRVWDLKRDRCTHIFAGHTSTVRCLQIVEPVNVNPDAHGPPVWEPPYPLVVTGSRDWTLRVWKLPSSERDPEYLPYIPNSPSEASLETATNPYHLCLLEGHTHAVRALAAHGRVLVSGSYDTTVRVWDTLSGKCQHTLHGHGAKVYSVVLDHRRAQCASGSMDGTVRLWSTQTGECLRELDGHTSLVGLLGLSHNQLVSAAADSTLRVWDADTGELNHTLAAHSGAITCFQHDDRKIVSGSDGTLKMWDVSNGTFVRDLLTGLSGVWQVGFDERFCVAAVQRNQQSEFDGAHARVLFQAS